MNEVGCFGKVPAHGDFVWQALPARFVTPWDNWLQGQLLDLKEQLGIPDQVVFASQSNGSNGAYWKIDDLRTLVLNSICWTAKREIPTVGVRTSLPDLAVFEPAAVEPEPRPKKK